MRYRDVVEAVLCYKDKTVTSTGQLDPRLYPLLTGSSNQILNAQADNPVGGYNNPNPAPVAGMSPLSEEGFSEVGNAFNTPATSALALQAIMGLGDTASGGSNPDYSNIPALGALYASLGQGNPQTFTAPNAPTFTPDTQFTMQNINNNGTPYTPGGSQGPPTGAPQNPNNNSGHPNGGLSSPTNQDEPGNPINPNQATDNPTRPGQTPIAIDRRGTTTSGPSASGRTARGKVGSTGTTPPSTAANWNGSGMTLAQAMGDNPGGGGIAGLARLTPGYNPYDLNADLGPAVNIPGMTYTGAQHEFGGNEDIGAAASAAGLSPQDVARWTEQGHQATERADLASRGFSSYADEQANADSNATAMSRAAADLGIAYNPAAGQWGTNAQRAQIAARAQQVYGYGIPQTPATTPAPAARSSS